MSLNRSPAGTLDSVLLRSTAVERVRGTTVRVSVALALLGALVLAAPEARAQGVADEADVLFDMGVAAYSRGDFDEALAHFMQANRLTPNPAIAVNIGHTYMGKEAFPEAYRWYLEALDLGTDPEAIKDILEDVKDKVVLVEVVTDPPGADIYLDRRTLGVIATSPAVIALPTGSYKVIIDKPAYRSFESETFDLPKVGDSKRIETKLDIVTGRIEIRGDEGATVHLGDESAPALCSVPCDTDLPIGRQLLYIKKPGYRGQPSLVEIVEGKVARTTTELVLITGSIRVETGEPGSLVEVDGQPAGFTPAIVTGVPAGRRVVRVSREGYVAKEIEVEVPKDGQIDLGRVVLDRTNEVQSASRYRQDIFEAPASISVIRKEELDAFRYPTLVDSLRGVRGVHTEAWYGANAVGVIGIRGLVPIPAVDPGQRTRFLRDGLVMETQTNSFGIQSQRAQEVQSIEVQRGSGSVLYGTGAISGLVSVFTRDRVRESTAEVEGGVIGKEAQGRAFVGLGDEELGVWASVNGFNSRGLDQTLHDVPLVDDNGAPVLDANGEQVIEDIPLDDLQPASGVSVEAKAWAKDLELRYAHIQQEGLLNYGVRITPPNLWDANTSTTRRHLLDLVYRPQISDAVSLDSRVYAQSHYDTLLLNGAGFFVDRANTDQWGGVEARVFIDPIRSWRDAADEKRRFRISIGTEYHLYPKAQNDQLFAVPAAELFDFQTADENDMSVLATYALADLRPVDEVAFSVGGRVDSWNQRTDFVQFNPRLVGMLFPTQRDVIKVIAGRGFRVGDISERLTSTPPLIALPGPIDPETAWTGEIEARHRFDNDWSVLASAWIATIEGLIEQRANEDGLLESQNAFNGRIRGVDVEVAREFRGGWMLNAWYSRQQPESALIVGGASADEFLPLPGAPKEQAATKFTVPLSQGTRLATRVIYEGKRQLSGVDGTTDDAVLADVVLTGGVGNDAGSWFVGAYNVTSRSWATAASTSTFVSVEAPEFERALLRAGVELKAKLNRKAATTQAAATGAEPMPEPPAEAPADAPAPEVQGASEAAVE